MLYLEPNRVHDLPFRLTREAPLISLSSLGAFVSELLRLIFAAEHGDFDVSPPVQFLHLWVISCEPKMKQLKTKGAAKGQIFAPSNINFNSPCKQHSTQYQVMGSAAGQFDFDCCYMQL